MASRRPAETLDMNVKPTLTVLPDEVSICRLGPDQAIPDWAHNRVFSAITRTRDELSIVCFADEVPDHLKAERGWRILKMEGPFDLSLIGILAGVANVLKASAISLFVVSTFDTDYVLVRKDKLGDAMAALTTDGYHVNPQG